MKPKPADYRAERPVYWMILIVNDQGKVGHSRGVWDKCSTPHEAAMSAYAMPPSPGMRFFDLGPNLRDARKVLKRIDFEAAY